MIQEILILLLFLYICNNKNKNIEGVEDSSYCDGMSSFLFDERCSSDHVYRVIKTSRKIMIVNYAMEINAIQHLREDTA